jgi:RimJ/RimL family protein N-acetyltransferase
VEHTDGSRGARLAAFGAASTALALHSDRALGDLVDTATPLGAGIGGRSALLEVAGTPVFVKRVPLTEWERRPEHIRSTANLFELPAICHYGVGGPGFGAWRELAAHTMTTDWVLTARHEGFPLMYHWRVLPDPDAGALPEELADIERTVAFWGGGSPVRHRLRALEQSSASLTLFLEYIPQNVHGWLATRLKAGPEAAERACAMVERELADGIAFMNAHGLLHFDAHFENLLTDGRRLYFADYGLALSSRFELSPDELDFFDRHQGYDRGYAANHLVNWLVVEAHGLRVEDRGARSAIIRAYADGAPPAGAPPRVAALLTRYAPTAVVMSGFLGRLQRHSTRTPYPREEVDRLAAGPGRIGRAPEDRSQPVAGWGRLEPLAEEHGAAVLAFETANRGYFAASIVDRGDAFFEQFADRHRALLAEQAEGVGAFYVLVADDGSVLGRFNLYDIKDGAADLGYRVAQRVAGRGAATAAVRELCRLAPARHGLRTLRAGAALGNTASQRVLAKAGFHEIDPPVRAGPGGRPSKWYRHDLTPPP